MSKTAQDGVDIVVALRDYDRGDSDDLMDRAADEIERLRKIETAAERLRTQRNRYDTLGCNWTCRKMLDLFNSLDERNSS